MALREYSYDMYQVASVLGLTPEQAFLTLADKNIEPDRTYRYPSKIIHELKKYLDATGGSPYAKK